MALLNISYTEESSVLTEGEISFTLYENTICPILGLCTIISIAHDLTSWPCA